MTTTQKTDNAADGGSSPVACYASFWGRLLRKWDWWIYCRSFHTLRRMTLNNPGMAYLMELQIKGWNRQLNISPELKRATEAFHDSMREHSQHNAELCQPCPPSTPPRQETADGQGLA